MKRKHHIETSVTLLDRLKQSRVASADWERFVDLYSPLIAGAIWRSGLRQADFEDATQSVFLKCYQKLKTFEYNPKQSFGKWLWTVCRNECIDLQRKGHPLQAGSDEIRRIEAGEDLVDELEFREWFKQLVLKILKEDFKEHVWKCFWLSVYEGKSTAEIEVELGLNTNQVHLNKS